MDIFRKAFSFVVTFFRDFSEALSSTEPISEEKLAAIRSDPDTQNPVDQMIR